MLTDLSQVDLGTFCVKLRTWTTLIQNVEKTVYCIILGINCVFKIKNNTNRRGNLNHHISSGKEEVEPLSGHYSLHQSFL